MRRVFLWLYFLNLLLTSVTQSWNCHGCSQIHVSEKCDCRDCGRWFIDVITLFYRSFQMGSDSSNGAKNNQILKTNLKSFLLQKIMLFYIKKWHNSIDSFLALKYRQYCRVWFRVWSRLWFRSQHIFDSISLPISLARANSNNIMSSTQHQIVLLSDVVDCRSRIRGKVTLLQ